ncbi:hypothetical protein [Streptomyces sp. NPDC047097]|uniref:hypothetical protein n=1 Tax=Streptomyces sp. NPDC047097 TaxID=3155260 RepID=UPI0033FD5D53
MRAATFAATCVLLAAVGHVHMSGSPVAWPGLAAAFAVLGALAYGCTGRERPTGVVTAATVAAQAGLHAAFTLTQAMTTARPAGASLLDHWTGHLLCRPPAPPAVPAHPVAHLGHHGGALTGHPAHGSAASAVDHGTALALTGHPAHRLASAADPMSAAMPATHAPAADSAATVAVAGHDMAAMSPLGMLSAHLLAALLCGLWLAYGERVAFRAVHAVAGLLSAPLRVVFHLVPLPATPSPRPRRRRATTRLRRLLLAASRETRGPPLGTAVS